MSFPHTQSKEKLHIFTLCNEVVQPDTSQLQTSKLSVRIVLPEAKDIQIPES